MNLQKIAYYSATGILTVIMCFSVYNYLVHYEVIVGYFERYQYPSYLVYPLAVAKILGLIAIWGNFSKSLKEWAYAGFFFDITLAIAAHLIAKDGGQGFAIVAFIALMSSYFLEKQIRK